MAIITVSYCGVWPDLVCVREMASCGSMLQLTTLKAVQAHMVNHMSSNMTAVMQRCRICM